MNSFPSSKGYVVIPNVIPQDLIDKVIEDIKNVIDVPTYHESGGMIELYHSQSLWDVRQHPHIYNLFTSILNTHKLWVSIDRVSYKKGNLDSCPIQDDYYNNGNFIHWDININQNPRPFEVQGVLSLVDTNENMGGFQCVPSLYQNLDEYIESQPTKKVIYPNFKIEKDEAVEFMAFPGFENKIPNKWKIEQIATKAGDLIIWDSFLPHGNSSNKTNKPRIAQYITMFPEGDERLRQERVNCWKNNKLPSGWPFFGNPHIKYQKEPFELTDLGKKLVGVDRW